MKILADESVDAQVVDRLRQDGFDILYVAEISPSISDTEVLNLANKESALLLTGIRTLVSLFTARGGLS